MMTTDQTKNLAGIVRVCRQIETSDELPPLSALAETAGLSPSHFHRTFKQVTGLTPKAYAAAHRAERVRSALPAADRVTDVIYETGFSSSSRFYEKADDMLGMKPDAYRAGGVDQTIRFAVGLCTLGSILVASSSAGLCAILLGDDPAELVRDLEARFPRAELLGGDAAFEEHVAVVIGFVEAPHFGLGLPLDIRGTAFQQRVWSALQKIPCGQTASYAEVAAMIGAPKSSRAIAGACAANPLAIAIPCHRVVRSDGGLSGYRWGVERKKLLLAREATNAPYQKTS